MGGANAKCQRTSFTRCLSRVFVNAALFAPLSLVSMSNVHASDQLREVFLRICVYGVPYFDQVSQDAAAAGIVLGDHTSDFSEFWQENGSVYGSIHFAQNGNWGSNAPWRQVSCTAHDPDSSLTRVKDIAYELMKQQFGQEPKRWYKDGVQHAWFTTYPWGDNQDIYFGFDDRTIHDVKGGGTLHAYFRRSQ
jgi:hypothetical protein